MNSVEQFTVMEYELAFWHFNLLLNIYLVLAVDEFCIFIRKAK